jgi:cytidylate kinase
VSATPDERGAPGRTGKPDAATAHTSGQAATGRTPFTGVVALDGPSGTGKSTVARRLADRLGARYLDTGAMYRAATLAVLRGNGPRMSDSAILDVVTKSCIDISTDPHHAAIRLEGDSVDAEIRSSWVTGEVSRVAAIAEVRTHIVAQQRDIIEHSGGIVVEGRDIGSTVWPAARPKIYLTATPEARARRRAGELAETDLAAVASDIARRDRLDSTRATSPLSQPPDAIVVDTTELDIDQVVDRLVDIVRRSAG